MSKRKTIANREDKWEADNRKFRYWMRFTVISFLAWSCVMLIANIPQQFNGRLITDYMRPGTPYFAIIPLLGLFFTCWSYSIIKYNEYNKS